MENAGAKMDGPSSDEILLAALSSPDFHLDVWRRLRDAHLKELEVTTDARRRARLEASIAEAKACISALLAEREARERRKALHLVGGGKGT